MSSGNRESLAIETEEKETDNLIPVKVENKEMASPGSSLYVFQVICLYWVVSISMVYLNKILVSSPDISIPAPVFITWFQVTDLGLIFIITVK